ncbi:hypothetical protein CEXT_377901 [Caerostris extrusa]|uniref:Spindle and kinetochore-associated protein 3 n=1 Tax=Caerostris extrusa TaxID=172846 RepID=A0AAV4NSL6_CAEEX|nr:hypothetical protein CEXT_377901 [Caerostris extrusa]
MAFLSSLRECVKKIESDVADVKHSYLCFESEETDKRSDFCLEMSRSIKKEITPLKHDYKQIHMSVNMDASKTYPKSSKRFGYEPFQLESCEEEYPVELSCNESKISEHELSLTPELNLPSLTEKKN